MQILSASLSVLRPLKTVKSGDGILHSENWFLVDGIDYTDLDDAVMDKLVEEYID